MEGSDFEAFRILFGDFVVEIILAGDAQGHGLQLHVEVLGHQDGGMLILFLERQARSHDPVIHGFAVGKDPLKAAHGGRETIPVGRLVHENPHGASTRSFHPTGDPRGLVIKNFGEEPVDRACIGSAFALFVLESVQFPKNLDGDDEMVVLEALEALRIMQEDIGVDDEILDPLLPDASRIRRDGYHRSYLLGSFERLVSEHGGSC